MALRAYTPAEFREIAGQLGTVYGEGEREILRLLADGNLTGWKEAFLTQRLAEVRTIVAGLDQAAVSWAGVHIPAIYEHKLALGAQMAGLSPVMTALHQEQVALIQRSVVTSLNYANGGIGRAVEDVYRRASLEALQSEMVGGGSGEDVAKRYLTNLRENGITSFTDRAGRSWNMETYAEMVAETNSREASWAATINQVLEEGEDLVRISDHLDECPLCRPWEGKVVSITGLTEGYPTLEEARATGFGHPRCLHELLPYDGADIPFTSVAATEKALTEKYPWVKWDLEGIDEDGRRAIVSAWEDFAAQHPDIAAKMERVNSVAAGDEYVASMAHNYNLSINRDWWGNTAANFAKHRDPVLQAAFKMDDGSPIYVFAPHPERAKGAIVHEFGHAVDATFGKIDPPAAIRRWRESVDMRNELLDMANPKVAATTRISIYAQDHPQEAFAESWTWMHSGLPKTGWPAKVQELHDILTKTGMKIP